PAVAFGGVGAGVVAVEAGPLDVVLAGIEGAQVAELVFEVDVRAPDPDRVGGARRGEDVVDVAPGADELAGAIAVRVLGPREPVAVHLPVVAQEEGVPPAAGVPRPVAD